MAADINSYSLAIAFELSDKAALGQLDIIDERLGKIDKQINDMATKTMAAMSANTTQLNTVLTQVALQYEKINQSTVATLKPLKESSTISIDDQKRLTKEAAVLKDDVLKTWIDIIKILDIKDKQLQNESKTIEKEEKLVKKVKEELSGWSQMINSAANALSGYIKGLVDVRAAIKEALNDTELFHHANYRLYGSQTELVGRARLLSLEYSVMRQEAVQAIQALGNLRVPDEMLNKLAGTTAQFNRLSGVSIQQTAGWQKNLVAMGSSAADIERRMTHMAVAMRRFGLDTSDVNAIMRTQQEQAQYLRQLFGDKTTGEIQRAQVAIAAFAKELGATPEVAQQAAAALGTIEPWHLWQLGAAAGIAADEMNTAEGQTKALAIVTAELADQLRATEDPYSRRSLLLAMQGQYGDKLGTSMYNLALQQAASNSKIKDGVASQKLMADALSGHIGKVNNLNQIYTEANNTIPRQLDLLKNAFYSAIGAIWTKIEPAVILFLTWVNSFVYAVGKVISVIGEWLDALGPVGTTIKYIAAIVMVAVVVFAALFIAFNLFGIASKMAGAAGHAMGLMIQKALEGLAKGLSALASHKATMLTLALLLVAMGLGAFLFALGVAKIAEHGTAGIKALLGLTIAIVLLAVGLALAGKIAQSAIGGLLALSVALLAVGVAAYLLASSVQMMVAAGMMGLVFLAAIVVAMLVVVIVMAVIAAAGPEIYVGMLVVALALLIVAAAAWVLAKALEVAVGALSQLNLDMALNILKFSLVMLFVGPVLALASVGILIGAILLAIAGNVLLVAGFILFVAGVLIALAGLGIFLAGAGVYYGALMMNKGALLLAQAAGPLQIGTLILVATAPLLVLAGTTLAIAAIPLFIAGVLIGIAGLGFLLAGVGIYYGGSLMNKGAPLLMQAAGPLQIAALILMAAAPLLLVAAIVLAIIGIALLIAGVGIFLAGLLMVTGAAMMYAAGGLLIGGAKLMVTGAMKMVEASPILATAALLLMPAAVILLIAGILMLIPAIVLAVVGVLLLIAGIGILLGGMMIKAGAWFLLGAGEMIIKGAGKIALSALILGPTSILLAIVAIVLLVAAVIFIVASVVLLVAGVVFLVAALALAGGAVFFEVAAQTLWEWSGPFLWSSIKLGIAGIILAIAAIAIGIAAVALAAASIILIAASTAMWLASWPMAKAADAFEPIAEQFKGIGIGIRIGGLYMLAGVKMLIDSASLLNLAGKMLSAAASELEADLEPMKAVAALSGAIAGPIQALGNAIYIGAVQLMYGAMWLINATKLLQEPVVLFYQEAVWLYQGSMYVLAASMMLVRSVGMLGVLTDVFATEIKGTANELFLAMDLILNKLEVYGDKITAQSDRIARAFRGILPTIPLSIIGMHMVQAQSLITTRTHDASDVFYERGQRQEDQRIQRQIINILEEVVNRLAQLDTSVNKVVVGDTRMSIGEIIELLKEHLPNIVRAQSPGLAHALSEWMR